MTVAVVIPTFNRRDSLAETLTSLERQTLRPDVHVVDNASKDGTAELVESRFSWVSLIRNETNDGFGRAVNRAARSIDGEILVVVNNDVVCDEHFVERIVAPFSDTGVGMVAGILVQADAPGRIDSAGVELDVTLGSWDYLWNQPLARVPPSQPPPAGPCGGAAAYRLDAFHTLGGFDENLFAYWEDVDLAIRLVGDGWRCALALDAVGVHKHGHTLGASPLQRELHAFGRGYVLGKYRVGRGLRRRVAVAMLDWPTLLVHLVARREPGPIHARRGGLRAGRSAWHGPPRAIATVSVGTALQRQFRFFGLRLRGRLPRHFYGDGDR